MSSLRTASTLAATWQTKQAFVLLGGKQWKAAAVRNRQEMRGKCNIGKPRTENMLRNSGRANARNPVSQIQSQIRSDSLRWAGSNLLLTCLSGAEPHHHKKPSFVKSISKSEQIIHDSTWVSCLCYTTSATLAKTLSASFSIDQ